MNKKTLLLLSSALIYGTLWAKDTKNLYLMPHVGMGRGGNYQEQMGNYRSNSLGHQCLGVDVGYQLGKHLGLYTGVALGLYSSNYINMKDGWYMNNHQVQLEQPVYLRYTTTRPQRVNLFINAGIQFSYNIGGSSRALQYEGLASIENDRKDLFNKAMILPFINPGVKFSFNNNWLDLGIFYKSALSDTYQSGPFSARMRQVGLKVALGIGVL